MQSDIARRCVYRFLESGEIGLGKSRGNFFLVPGAENGSSFDLYRDHRRFTCLGRIVATMSRWTIVALDPSAGSGGFSRHIAWLDGSTSLKDCCFLMFLAQHLL